MAPILATSRQPVSSVRSPGFQYLCGTPSTCQVIEARHLEFFVSSAAACSQLVARRLSRVMMVGLEVALEMWTVLSHSPQVSR